MTDVNWDDVTDQALASPRALLAEMLAEADDIKDIVICFTDKDGVQWTWKSVGNDANAVGMLELAKFGIFHEHYDDVAEH